MEIKYSTAAELNQVLGKLKIKSLDSSHFIKVITIKASVEAAVAKFFDLQKAVYSEYGIEPEYDGSIQVKANEAEKLKLVSGSLNVLAESNTAVEDMHILSMEQFESLHRENDLSMGEISLLHKWLVKAA